MNDNSYLLVLVYVYVYSMDNDNECGKHRKEKRLLHYHSLENTVDIGQNINIQEKIITENVTSIKGSFLTGD